MSADALPVMFFVLVLVAFAALYVARDIAIRVLADRKDARVARTSEAEKAAQEALSSLSSLRADVKRAQESAATRVRR